MAIEVGMILEGKVSGITKFGAFVDLPDSKTGMVHISEVANAYVSDIRQHLTEGQDVKVMVIGLENGKVNLSIKRLEPKPQRENGGNRNGNYRGAPRQDGGYRREYSAPAQNRPQRAPMQPAAPKTADQLFEEKLKAFNFNVITINGHDYDQIEAAIKAFHAETEKPTCIVMDTLKGKGVSFMENAVDWHGKGPNDEEYEIAMKELNAAYAALEEEDK